MASLSRSTPAADAPRKDVAERASRIAAMLARWSAEDISEEPEWSIDDIEPMMLHQAPDPEKRRT